MLKLFKTEKPMSYIYICIYMCMCVCMPTVLRSINKYKTFVDVII